MSRSSKKRRSSKTRMTLGRKFLRHHPEVSSPSTISFPVERPDHNSRVGYIVVPEFPPTDPRYGKPTPEGAAGVYRFTFVLSVPGKNVFREHVDLGKVFSEGDSLLMLPTNLKALEVRIGDNNADIGFLTLSANAHNRLATTVMKVNANSFREAEQTAYNMTISFLSFLSYSSDVAIDIAGYEVLEESTGTVKGVFGMVGNVKMVSVPDESGPLVSDNNYKRLFATYREGMNATNVFYQALSFYKAIEGCKGMRKMKNARAKEAGTKQYTPLLEMPKHLEELPAQNEKEFFQPFLGQKFTAIVEHFRPLIRNAIAHLDPSKDVLDIDHFEDVAECEQAIPVLRYMAREFIRAELDIIG